jgi:hypothetical protein
LSADGDPGETAALQDFRHLAENLAASRMSKKEFNVRDGWRHSETTAAGKRLKVL